MTKCWQKIAASVIAATAADENVSVTVTGCAARE